MLAQSGRIHYTLLMPHFGPVLPLTKFVQSGSETSGEFIRRTFPPIVEEYDVRPRIDHMLVNGNDVETVLPERFQNRLHFVFEHRDIARNHCLVFAAGESGPGVQAHPRSDRRAAHVFHVQIVTPDGAHALLPHPISVEIVAGRLAAATRAK